MNKNNMPKGILGTFRSDRILMLYEWEKESGIIVVLQSIGLSNGILSSKKTHLFCYIKIFSVSFHLKMGFY